MVCGEDAAFKLRSEKQARARRVKIIVQSSQGGWIGKLRGPGVGTGAAGGCWGCAFVDMKRSG